MQHERASTSRSTMQTHRLAIELNSSADLSKSTPDGDEGLFLGHGPSSRRPIRVTVEGRLAAATTSMDGRQGFAPMLTSGTQTKLQPSGSSAMASARPTQREVEKRSYDFKLVFSELHPSREAAIDFSIARPGRSSTNRATASSASCCATPPRSCAPAGRRCAPSLSKDRYRRLG